MTWALRRYDVVHFAAGHASASDSASPRGNVVTPACLRRAFPGVARPLRFHVGPSRPGFWGEPADTHVTRFHLTRRNLYRCPRKTMSVSPRPIVFNINTRFHTFSTILLIFFLLSFPFFSLVI